MRSLKSNKNSHQKKGGPDSSVSNNQCSPMTINELATKAKCNLCFDKAVVQKTADCKFVILKTRPKYD